jgi:hypothetical protein
MLQEILGYASIITTLDRYGILYPKKWTGTRIANLTAQTKPLRREGRAACAQPRSERSVPAGRCPLESTSVRPRPGGLFLTLSLGLTTIMCTAGHMTALLLPYPLDRAGSEEDPTLPLAYDCRKRYSTLGQMAGKQASPGTVPVGWTFRRAVPACIVMWYRTCCSRPRQRRNYCLAVS